MKQIFNTVILILLINLNAISQHQLTRFRHIGVDDGMSQNSGRFILQDSKGFIWIATEIGLNRYDGYNFKTFQHNPIDSNSISNNYLNCLLEGSDGKIWIGTDGGGLNYYDPIKEKIYRVNLKDTSDHHRSKYVMALAEDKNNNLWIGTAYGVYVFNQKTRNTKHYITIENDSTSISFPVIYSICSDSKNNIWLGTAAAGFNKFIPETESFKRYLHNKNSENTVRSNSVIKILESEPGYLWISNIYNTISKFDIENELFTHYNLSKFETEDGVYIRDIIEDDKNNLWIGTAKFGLWHYNLKEDKVLRYTTSKNIPNSISSNNIKSLLLDKTGALWVGSYFDGINILDTYAKPFNHYYTNADKTEFLNSGGPVLKDDKGDIWLGTLNGLFKYNTQNGFRIFRIMTKLFKTIGFFIIPV